MKDIAISIALVIGLCALGTFAGGAFGMLLIPIFGGGGHGLADLAFPVFGGILGGLVGIIGGIGGALWRIRTARRREEARYAPVR
jgi:membrane-bound ClpP family serine protease